MRFLLQMPVNKKIIASSALSFLWVGNYQYHYNIEAFNTHFINIWAFTLWLVGGYIFLSISDILKRKITYRYIQLLAAWAIYLLGLGLFEYTGYYILGIHENSARGGALTLGLIHGSSTLHVYYMTFPALILVLYQLLLVLPERIAKWLNSLRQTSGRYTTWP